VRAAILIGCALALGGCHGPSLAPSSVPNNERTSTAPAAQTARSASPSAIAAVRQFVSAYINWSAETVTDDMRSLAAQSIGQARAAMQLAASQTAGDYELRDGGVSNSGTIEAVAPLGGRPDQYVVVTRETTSATNSATYQGLRPAWHVAVATVTQLGDGGWVVSGWQPES
jgi:hypothetical protein